MNILGRLNALAFAYQMLTRIAFRREQQLTISPLVDTILTPPTFSWIAQSRPGIIFEIIGGGLRGDARGGIGHRVSTSCVDSTEYMQRVKSNGPGDLPGIAT